MCQARGVCLELLRWWNTKYTIEGHSTMGAFTTHLLMTQAAALLKYKRLVQQDNREGAPGCTLFMLTRQIENVLVLIIPGENPSAALQDWRKARARNISGRDDRELGFSTQDWDHIKIVEKQPPQHYGKLYSAHTSGRDLNPSQRHPLIFLTLVLHHLTRRSLITQVLGVWCGKCTKKAYLILTGTDKVS